MEWLLKLLVGKFIRGKLKAEAEALAEYGPEWAEIGTDLYALVNRVLNFGLEWLETKTWPTAPEWESIGDIAKSVFYKVGAATRTWDDAH